MPPLKSLVQDNTMIEAITLKEPFNNSSNQFSAKKKSVTYAEIITRNI